MVIVSILVVGLLFPSQKCLIPLKILNSIRSIVLIGDIQKIGVNTAHSMQKGMLGKQHSSSQTY